MSPWWIYMYLAVYLLVPITTILTCVAAFKRSRNKNQPGKAALGALSVIVSLAACAGITGDPIFGIYTAFCLMPLVLIANACEHTWKAKHIPDYDPVID